MENKKHFSTRFWGQMALVGIVVGALGSNVGATVSNPTDAQTLSVVSGLMAVLGWISLGVWLYRKAKKK